MGVNPASQAGGLPGVVVHRGRGGRLFAHQLATSTPATSASSSPRSAGDGLPGRDGSISGSIIAAVIFTILIEALRPLAVLKWWSSPDPDPADALPAAGLVRVPGLKLNLGLRPKPTHGQPSETEASDAAAAD
jgi:hypothetical protein